MDHSTPHRPQSATTTDLVKAAVDEVRTLVQLEVELAKRELQNEIAHMKAATMAFAVATLSAILGLTMFLLTLVLATGAAWELALTLGGLLLIGAGIAGLVGSSALPKRPLVRTRQRMDTGLHELKAHVA